MRCLMRVTIPVDSGNETISDGTLPKTVESILAELKPEAAYFLDNDGSRAGVIVFDLKDPSQIPVVAEPWFLAFNARVEIHPAMNIDDLKKAAGGIQKAVQHYGEVKKAA